MKTHKLLTYIYSKLLVASTNQRRDALIGEMQKLKSKEVNCFSCSGKCCTYVANSVQIDPLQALELLDFLLKENRWNDIDKNKLTQNINDFRLNHEISMGKGRTLRRYYTCPFFIGGSKGCSIDPHSKPYGCLGFNPTVVDAKEGNGCNSNTALLEKREDIFKEEENKANQYIKETLGIYWDKKPIPVALIEFAELL